MFPTLISAPLPGLSLGEEKGKSQNEGLLIN